ncbi:MAG TPA: HD domain-containing protein [Solirubrobacteraceae bacterium]|nr:HD domain-containing protein [Solirubrobacteraceae bacterium]
MGSATESTAAASASGVDEIDARGAVASGFAARRREIEELTLAPQAARSYPARRARPEPDCELRTPFQRDRDRIVHCKAFRRLKHKTQVFVAPLGDHYRTRLTHTVEVTAISRTVARALALNEDLTEAIGVGHDLGHPPFGHIGEEVLDDCLRERFGGGFRHYEHSLRVVEQLEPAPTGGGCAADAADLADGAQSGENTPPASGLNLTEQVRDGILRHSSRAPMPQTLEGRIVRVMDRVAYINHDIDDALRAGLLHERDLPSGPIAVLGASGSRRIDALVHDMVEHSAHAGDIVQGRQAAAAMDELREFMFARIYLGPEVLAERARIAAVVRRLFEHYVEHPDQLPGGTDGELDLAQRVTDYIAGMTDRYCIRRYTELQVPRAFAR